MAIKKKVVWLPYDMDTAIGINNEGELTFDYSLEDTDTVGTAEVYNGQDSVIWNNIRLAFADELAAMYKSLRSEGKLSYALVEQMFEAHQNVWPEALVNEDSQFKYLDPLLNPDTGAEPDATYLPMLQGLKTEQRKWWLYNRFRYIDSKYNAGDALTDFIDMRLYARSNVTITPYADIYPTAKFGSYLVTERGHRNVPTTLLCPAGLDNPNDTEFQIYSASQLADVGDLSGFYVGRCNISMATKLQSLKIGDSASTYSNTNLKQLTLGSNVLLRTLDVRNCPNLAQAVDVSNCTNIENIYFDGTSITGCQLPNGGILKILHLPSTVVNLDIRNQTIIQDLVVTVANLESMRLENTPTLDTKTMVNGLTVSTEQVPTVRITNFAWECANAAEIEALFTKLDSMKGLDINGNELPKPYLEGTIHTTSLTGAQIASYNQRYPYITVTADYVESTLTLMSYDNTTVLKTITCLNGVPQESIPSAPSKPDSADGHYSYTALGWSKTADAETADASATTDVIADRTVYPAYSKTVKTYTVTWLNADNTTLETDNNVPWGTTPTYNGSTPTYQGQTSTGWSPAVGAITGNTTYTAQYKPMYTATFVRASADGGGTLYTQQNVVEGTTPVYGGATPTSTQGSAEDYPFEGWTPALAPIYANTTYTAKFGSPVEDVEITDSWDTIIASIDAGTYKTKYKIGNYKPLDLGTEGTVNMQIVAFDADELASGGYAPMSFVAKELLATDYRMNSSEITVGGWEQSGMRSYLKNTIKSLIPASVRNRINPVLKSERLSDGGISTTVEDVWIPSHREVKTSTQYETTGVEYIKIFKDNATRIKSKNGNPTQWWTRSVYNNYYFAKVKANGEIDNYGSAKSLAGIALGFCLGLEPETITDSWSEIFAAEQDCTYSTKYSIGDTKMLDLGTEGQHLMEIVAFDEDDKADGSGKAKITWISKDQLNTTHAINASQKTVDGETAYTAGGWEHSDMRAYLKDTVKPLIPETVRNAIVPVTKIQSTYTGGALVKDGQTTTDDVWIPSNHEVGFGTDYETTGAVYSGKFTNSASRIKKWMGSAKHWWLRSASSANYFCGVYGGGGSGSNSAYSASGVALGFCT